MRRTMSMLRKLSGSVFAGVALCAAAMAVAQDQPLPPKDVPPALQPMPVPMPVGGQPVPGGGPAANAPGAAVAGVDPKTIYAVINITKTVGMTRAPGAAEDPIIEKVQNENPKVCRIQSIFNDPRHVLITGLAPGSSKVTFTGYTDPNMKDRHEEVFEVVVKSDEDAMRQRLRTEFLGLVKKTAPTANIDATVLFNTTSGPVVVNTQSANNVDTITKTGASDSKMYVFLTGNVMGADTVNTILESARAVFGANAVLVNNMQVGSVQQVEIDCVICSVNRSKVRNMSFSWSLNRKDFFFNSILGSTNFANTITTSITAPLASQTAAGGNIIFGQVNNDGAFFGFLQALRTDGLAKIQAEPKVVTLSGRPAQFVSGGETPILTSGGQGSPTVTYKTFGTTITVLPIVLGNGKIHLEVAPLISTLNAAAGISITGGLSTTVVPGFNTQGAQVAVQMEDGQTIAIGGLLQHRVNATNAKVPVLGDIPFVGAAFRTVNYDEREEELIILVTPRLVDPLACNQMPDRLPTKLTRSPDDFEFYLEGMLELPRGQRNTCGPNGCYQAPHRSGPTAGLYPCGDQSNASGALPGVHRHLNRGGNCATGNCGVTNAGGCANGSCGVNGTAAFGMAPGTAPAAPQQPYVAPAPNQVPVPAPLPQGAPGLAPQTDAGQHLPGAAGAYAIPLPNNQPPTSLAPVSYNPIPDGAPVAGPIAAPGLRFPNRE